MLGQWKDIHSLLHDIESNTEICDWLMSTNDTIHSNTNDWMEDLDDTEKIMSLLASLEESYGPDKEEFRLDHSSPCSCFGWVKHRATIDTLQSWCPMAAVFENGYACLYKVVRLDTMYSGLLVHSYVTVQNRLLCLQSITGLLAPGQGQTQGQTQGQARAGGRFVAGHVACYCLREKCLRFENEEKASDPHSSHSGAHSMLSWIQTIFRCQERARLRGFEGEHVGITYHEDDERRVGVLTSDRSLASSESDSSTHHGSSHEGDVDDGDSNPSSDLRRKYEVVPVISSVEQQGGGSSLNPKKSALGSEPSASCVGVVSAEMVASYLEEVKLLDRAGNCSCKLCGVNFSRKYELKRHIKTQHLIEQRKFECQLCHRRFKRTDHLRAHQRRIHGFPKAISQS